MAARPVSSAPQVNERPVWARSVTSNQYRLCTGSADLDADRPVDSGVGRATEGTFCRAREQAARIPELALHGDCDDLLTFTAAPISRQLAQPYSRSMTDEALPPRRGDELASQAGLRASHVDRDRVVELLRVAGGDGRLTAEELDERLE